MWRSGKVSKAEGDSHHDVACDKRNGLQENLAEEFQGATRECVSISSEVVGDSVS